MAGMRFFKTYLELIFDTCLEKLAKRSGKPVPDDVLERNAILREENLTASDLRRLSSDMQSPNTSGSNPKKNRSWMLNPMEKSKSMADLKSMPTTDIEMTMLNVNSRTTNKAADGELNNDNDMVTKYMYEMNQRLEMQNQQMNEMKQQLHHQLQQQQQQIERLMSTMNAGSANVSVIENSSTMRAAMATPTAGISMTSVEHKTPEVEEEEEDIQILVDEETGLSYSWNSRTGETEWVD